MKLYSLYIMYALFLLFGLGCDEGKIYPDETVDSGRTATVSLSFTGLKAWPKENMLSLCAFGEDKSKPLQTQRISKPAEDGKRLKLRLNNVTPDTRSIEVAVISRGLRLVYSYYTSPVDDSDEPLDLSVGELDLASFKRVQAQVFDLNCLSCHGGGSGLAGQLDLRDDVAYKSLVNVKAPLSEEGKNYVTPGDINDSFLLDILEDNPVHKTKILTVKENNRDIKVGYLMYNSFTAGTNSDPDKYNNELRQISQEFKTAGVKYVILDLRYNTGGSLDCVQLLGTILTSEARLNKPMAYLEYNNKNRDKDATINFDSEILKSGVNLDLPALFAITSSTTAGAPEMLIRSLSLKDSYPVVTIGGVTKGQNVATEQFINEEFLWSINPVVCTVYDSNHDAGGAISPATDLKISETTIDGVTNYSEFLPFGDPNERMLKVAIGVIDGSYPPKDEETEETTKAQFKIEKSVISPASRRFSSNGLRLK